jgi:hypothetical protein
MPGFTQQEMAERRGESFPAVSDTSQDVTASSRDAWAPAKPEIDPSKLEFAYRSYANSPDDERNTYGLNFNYNGNPYTFIPKSVVDKGISVDGNATIFKNFLDQDYLNNFLSSSTPVDLSNVSWYGDYLKNNLGASSSGYLLPGNVDLGTPITYEGTSISGLGNKTFGGSVYNVNNPAHERSYISGDNPYAVQNWDTVHNSGGNGFLNQLASGVSDFFSDPAKATTNFFENPGVKEAALIAASVYAPELLGELGTGAGADVAADVLGSGIVEGGGLDALAAATDLTAGELAASELAAYPTSGIVGTIPAAATGALPITAAAPSAAELVAAGTTEGGTLPTALGNEAVASGMSPGSLGAAAAAADVLTPTQLAAAAGAGGLGALTGADAATAALAASPNEMVASGLSPGAAGAAGAAAGILTPAQLAAAAGTTTGGLNLLDLAKGASTFNDLLNSFKKGAKLGSLDGSDSSGSGSRLGSDLARVGQMGSGNPLLHSVQGLYSGSPTGFAEGGSTNSGLDSYNPLMKDVVKVGDVGKSIPLTRELASLYENNALAHGGQPHVDPRLMALIRARANPADKQHPNYDGTPVFRTGGLEGLGGKYVEGKGDGTSDDITAMLANGEYVFSADVVSALGNGSNKAGAKKLGDMVKAIRSRARSAPPDKLPPDAKSPLEYLKPSKGKQA